VAASQYKKEKKIATKSRPNETHNNMYVGSPYCRAKIYVDESRWLCRRDRQTDRRTDARPLHYALRCECDQRNNYRTAELAMGQSFLYSAWLTHHIMWPEPTRPFP